MELLELTALMWQHAYWETAATLDWADTATDKAAKAAQEAIEDIERRATTLPDGRRVYQTRDGKQIFLEDGSELQADQTADIEWKQDSPVWEDRQSALAARDDIAEYDAFLDRSREELQRLDKNEEGLSPEERLEATEYLRDEAIRRMPAFVKDFAGPEPTESDLQRRRGEQRLLQDEEVSQMPPASAPTVMPSM
ncbi:hypothetical protein AUP43_16545 [Oceanibaculum pacificum]|uniref:Uncharacterized protein n=2 Tax=Oceanibaculum pacificum TaxID=580166 RepID=A0A154WFT6_9PROT|nr:hypothetical protein AUP43_16545 [Oceanibaculum pacificum]